MRLDFCADCGATEDLDLHHLIPRCLGGLDDETNQVRREGRLAPCHPEDCKSKTSAL
jgi:hypothetical protein